MHLGERKIHRRAAHHAGRARRAATGGGSGSLLGSFVGSIIIGFIYNFGQALLPELAYFVLFLPMVLVLVLRPQGLFGGQVL